MIRFLTLKRAGYSYACAYPEDTARIVAVLKAAGYAITPEHAAEAWHQHCEDTSAAGWLDLYDEDDWIVSAILDHTDCQEIET